MSDMLSYNGYYGSAEVSVEDECLHGKILFIEDTISYEGQSFAELAEAFKDAVDDYIQTCQELGIEPKASCKGTFNVRVGEEIHRKAAILARVQGKSLNDLVKDAIVLYLDQAQNVTVVHKHQHEHFYHFSASAQVTEFNAEQDFEIEDQEWSMDSTETIN